MPAWLKFPPPLALPSARATQTRDTTTGRLGLAATCLFVAAVWFLTLDARHLLPSDEGRYAEIAREMLASGDWVTIRYNGVKYFEKPPFQMWMTALAFQAFGIGEWQARLWVALNGALGIVMTAVAARRWFGPRVGAARGAGPARRAGLESGRPLQLARHGLVGRARAASSRRC